MRFDLLDEYSTLVPFGLAVRNGTFQEPAVPAKAAKRGAIANFTSHLRKLLGALVAKYSCLF